MWPRRCSVYRWRELVGRRWHGNRRTCRPIETLGFLAARGRTTSSGHCECESTDAGHRGGPARSSGEGPCNGVGAKGPGSSRSFGGQPFGEEPDRSTRQKNAGLWEPYDGRLSRTVLREREGEVPSRHSPGSATLRGARYAPCVLTQRPHPRRYMIDSTEYLVERAGQVECDYLKTFARVFGHGMTPCRPHPARTPGAARVIMRGGVGQQFETSRLLARAYRSGSCTWHRRRGADRAIPPRQGRV